MNLYRVNFDGRDAYVTGECFAVAEAKATELLGRYTAKDYEGRDMPVELTIINDIGLVATDKDPILNNLSFYLK